MPIVNRDRKAGPPTVTPRAMRYARLICVALVMAVCGAQAGLPDKRFVYRADGKRLTEVLQDFAAAQSISVVIDAGIEGTVNGQFDARPEDFMRTIGKSYGVIWYFDGMALFVYPSRMIQSRLFRLRGYSRNKVQRMLASMGLGDPRYPLRFNDAEQTLLAYGPPRHIELVQTVIDTLDGSARDRVGSSIRVFPLVNTVAADRISGNVRVPGLASTLNNLFTRGSRAAGGAPEANLMTGADTPANGNPNKRRAQELAYGARAGDPESGPARKDGVRDPAGRLVVPEAGVETARDDTPFFQADEASNAIIVRGVPERMAQYQTLIRQLDVAQPQVEIEATIIDVSTESFDSLGIEWDYSRVGKGGIFVSPGSPNTGSGGGSSPTLFSPNVTTLVADAGRSLLARIRALEGNGRARIVSRPKVLGMANRTASMVDRRLASVRVAGNLDANLFTVEAGTTLQVMPQIVTGVDRKELRLSLFIEDGAFEGKAVDAIPIIKRTEIRTEAALLEGESLLIGGISVDSDIGGRSGLPGLSRVPLVGGLFRHDESGKVRRERLFLITPKVVGLQAAPVAVPSSRGEVPLSGPPRPQTISPATPPASPPATPPAAAPGAPRTPGLPLQMP
ncbi:type III secretion system outer membrane ring subunit SctC [Ramlibacter tataouinensis]|uniref:type III secretion system outer membrane ring subunit SctC n=1 Tax=Ramlibacter tataouinensis TaxID=94132 RepID=UPI001305334C|nr:type III secretion system outer membrane ring subunit SctC [Ramlibacter tataouinensis]